MHGSAWLGIGSLRGGGGGDLRRLKGASRCHCMPRCCCCCCPPPLTPLAPLGDTRAGMAPPALPACPHPPPSPGAASLWLIPRPYPPFKLANCSRPSDPLLEITAFPYYTDGRPLAECCSSTSSSAVTVSHPLLAYCSCPSEPQVEITPFRLWPWLHSLRPSRGAS